MYIGASLALVADLTPEDLLVPSVALFMFLVTLLGGNGPLLVPLVADHFLGSRKHHTFHFTAAVGEGGGEAGSTMEYAVEARSGFDLQHALLYILCSLYLASAVVYFSVALRLLSGKNTRDTLKEPSGTRSICSNPERSLNPQDH